MVRLTACGCGARTLVRIDRSFWMRLVPTRRLYYCPLCRTDQFLSRKAMMEALRAEPRPPVARKPLEMEIVTLQLGESIDPDVTVPARYV